MENYFDTENIPSPSNCPMLHVNGMCMCANMSCDEVKDFHCTSMRSAYIYGYNTMARVASERVNRLSEKITSVLRGKDGEQE